MADLRGKDGSRRLPGRCDLRHGRNPQRVGANARRRRTRGRSVRHVHDEGGECARLRRHGQK